MLDWLKFFPQILQECGFSPKSYFIIFVYSFRCPYPRSMSSSLFCAIGLESSFCHNPFSRPNMLQQDWKVELEITCVNISVFFHVWFLVEALATKRTRIRPRVAVDQKMRWKGWRTLELLVTNMAIVNLKIIIIIFLIF